MSNALLAEIYTLLQMELKRHSLKKESAFTITVEIETGNRSC